MIGSENSWNHGRLEFEILTPYVVQVFYSSHQSSAIHHIRLATPRGHGQLAFWYAYQKVSRLTATSIHYTTRIDRSTIQRWFPNNSFFEPISEIFPSFLIQAEGKFEPTAQDVETSIDFLHILLGGVYLATCLSKSSTTGGDKKPSQNQTTQCRRLRNGRYSNRTVANDGKTIECRVGRGEGFSINSQLN